jgi:hypothetical protein
MKKALSVAVAAVLVLGLSGLAMAWWGGPGAGGPGWMMGGYGPQGMMGQGWGPGGGWGRGMGRGRGAGYGPGGGPCWQQGGPQGVKATAIDDAKAKELAGDYVKQNLPGYSVEKLVKFERPGGTMYQVEVKGPQSEVRYLHINPWGNVVVFGGGRQL